MTPKRICEDDNSGSICPVAYMHNEILLFTELRDAKTESSKAEIKIANAVMKNSAADPIPTSCTARARNDWISNNAM